MYSWVDLFTETAGGNGGGENTQQIVTSQEEDVQFMSIREEGRGWITPESEGQ